MMKNVKTGSLIPVDEYRKSLSKKKGNKFNNKRVTAETIWGTVTFDSTGEYNCYLSLLPDYQMGRYKMERQVTYTLEVNGVKICDYRADFVLSYPDGSKRVIDFKGVETAEFKLKKRLMKACFDIEVELITQK